MNPTKKSLRWKYVLLFTLLAVSVFTISAFASGKLVITRLPADLYVEDLSGFDISDDAIHFGAMRVGSVGRRDISLYSSGVHTIAIVYPAGEIASWIELSNRFILVKPDSEETITAYATVPMDADYGTYKGEVVITKLTL